MLDSVYAGMTRVIAEPYLGERNSCMATINKFISVDEHVQEHPEVWTKRLSRAKWGERIPPLAKNSNGKERWFVDGREIALDGVADCGAADVTADGKPATLDRRASGRLRSQGTSKSDGCGGHRLCGALSNRRRDWRAKFRPHRRSRIGARLRASLQRLAARRMGGRESSASCRNASCRWRRSSRRLKKSAAASPTATSGVIYPSIPMELRECAAY